MYYYRLKNKSIDGNVYFTYLKHERKISKEKFQKHLEGAFSKLISKDKNKEFLLTSTRESDFAEEIPNIFILLKKLYGYESISVEKTIEYAESNEKMKKTGFKKEEIKDDGVILPSLDYRPFQHRKIRKINKERQENESFFIYRIKEYADSTYFYPLIFKERLSTDSFFYFLEDARHDLLCEKGTKPIIGIDLANKLIEKYGFNYLKYTVTATWESSMYGSSYKNKFGFFIEASEESSFEKDYPDRRDPNEEYLIEGNVYETLRYFSKTLSLTEKPKLIEIGNTWYAYNEVIPGNYRTKINHKDAKLITRESQWHKKVTSYEDGEKKYLKKIEEAINNSISLNETIILS